MSYFEDDDRTVMIPIDEESEEKLLNNDEVRKRVEELRQDGSIIQVMEEQFDVLKKFLTKLEDKYHIKMISYSKDDFDRLIWKSIEFSMLYEGINLAAKINSTIQNGILLFLTADNIIYTICDIVQFQINRIEAEILSKVQDIPNVVIRCNILQ